MRFENIRLTVHTIKFPIPYYFLDEDTLKRGFYMKFYLAPMEGLTGYIFRNAYHKYFHAIDKYFTPFIASKGLNHKELNDVLPKHNQGLEVVPQILTNKAEDFLAISVKLQEFGYKTVNLNLGCPSGTVTAKKRGAGFLEYPEELNCFLGEIFEKCPLSISVKTRIGVENPREWDMLQMIFVRYPFEEMILHPRLRNDFYANHPNLEVFRQAAETLPYPVCYNGDIHTLQAYSAFQEQFPDTPAVMLGRGILKNPGLVGEIQGNPKADTGQLKAFHEELLSGYQSVMSGDTNTLYKMKEFWSYFGQSFQEPDKYLKKIKKAKTVSEYRVIVDGLFRDLAWKGQIGILC